MINFFKAGGSWSFGDFDYTVKAVEHADYHKYDKSDSWFRSLDELIKSDEDSYKVFLREKIGEFGEKVGGNASVETLEAKLKELQDGDSN